MASDLSSECTETIGVLDEKEEGEISLEDVSSSEEGHLNYGYGTRASHCSNCSSTQHNAAWCTTTNKFYPKGSNRREVDLIIQDAVQGKENRHQVKESGCAAAKHTASTLQEKNDDLVPISSDSDMEIVGLADNIKRLIVHSSSKNRVKKKKKKKRNHANALTVDDFVSPSTVDTPMTECVNTLKHEMTKTTVRSYHREMSPVHRNRPRLIPRSPPRKHRSLARARSPFRRSKSPKRSPYRSLTKPMPRKTSHVDLMSSHKYVDTHKLLKRVRELDSIGTHSLEETLNKNKEHASSLKDKLTNMMKGVSDNNSDVTDSLKDKSTMHASKKESNDADDEEDLALLRQKALETKQNKSSKQNDQSKTENAKIDDDQDQEDLVLRMIALRSAVLKKHQNRIQKGMKSGKYEKCKASRSESPFTQSFLDSIPIPGEELRNFASPPHTPLSLSENNHTEDLPYSPTDKITSNIPMDTELLGIQPSDVSFINLTEVNSNQNFNKSLISSQDDEKSYQGKIIENRSYLPNTMYYTSQNSSCPTTTSMQCSTEISDPHFMNVHNSDRNLHRYESTCNISKNNNTSEFVDVNSSQEMPYSPTDTPVYDPDLSHALPQTCGPLNTSSSSLISLESYSPNTRGNTEQCNHLQTTQYVSITKQEKHKNEDERLNKKETVSLNPVVGSVTTSLMESLSPSNSMITIDDLTEVGTDASPLTDSLRNMKSTECIPRNLPKNNNGKGIVSEPFYMKGVPDVTKDTNKIPTLINRTLVPAPILRTNKQLQLPLPTKKCTMQQEPIFKSANMQPVIINEESNTKMNISFKPIKLTCFAQKSNSVLIIPTAFHDSLQEDTATEVALNKTQPSLVENNRNLTLIQTNITETNSDTSCDIKNPLQSKKKLLKKGLKRKSTGSVSLTAKKCHMSDTNSDNTSTLDKERYESNEDVNIGNKQNVNEFHQEANSKDSIHSVMSDNLKNETSVGTNKQGFRTDEASEQLKGAENRRQSLDEDEEALRAILLASLPKRTKTTNNIPKSDASVASVAPATSTTSSISNTTVAPSVSNATSVPDETVTNQTVSKVVLAGVNITNTTNVDGSTSSTISHITSHELKNDKSDNNVGEKNNLQKNASVENAKISNSITSERKRSVPISRGPQKKLVKRISIPASTKVVNNAKKYQNTMIQKKLNLQKATLYNKQKVAENKVVSKAQSYDTKSSVNTKTLSDTQRIVINLDSDTESDSESERQKEKAASIANSVIMENHQSTVNPTTDFEKNLDQFLRAVRKKQESMAAARPTSLSQTPKKDTVFPSKADKSNSSNLHTPLAVRHLPASQQEEYRRLKQQILEREKLKLHRTLENNSSLKSKSVDTPSKSTVSNSPTKDLGLKVNQTIPGKHTQSINAQLDKENFSKNLVDPIKNISVSTTNVQLCSDKMYNIERQENTSPSHIKTISRPITSLNVHTSTDNDTKNNSNNTQSTSTSRIEFESPINSAQLKTKTSPGLKILSSDEVNRKYVQIQVKNYTNERVVTINDKVTLNDKTLIKRNENISVNKNSNNKSICDYDINQIIECVERDVITNHTAIGSNNMVDSDASTIILPRGNQNTEKDDSFDTSESTIRLSQYQDDSCTPSISNAEGKDDSHFLLFKNNASPKSTRSIEENWEAIRKDVKTELNTLINLSQVEQEQRLMDTEQKLVMKRYTILDDLAEMSGNLRQWHMERDLQTHLAAEVKKLREQLKVAEERLQVQRNRINSIGPKVIAAHGKINAGRQECFKLATICSTLGNRVIGKEYKVPEAGAQLLDSRIKEVANHTRQLSRKKVPSIDISETHDFSRLGEETVITTCTEMSQTESLLPGMCSVDDIDASILKEDETLLNSAKKEKAVQEKVTSENPQRINIEEEMISSNSVSSNNARSTPKENSTEQDVFNEQTNISDTPLATVSALNLKDTQDLDNKEASESNTVRPATMDPDSKKKNFASPDGEFQMKKTLLPYESILAHFKLARNANPNGILCPYELMGTCSDGDCQFVHQTENQAK